MMLGATPLDIMLNTTKRGMMLGTTPLDIMLNTTNVS